MQTLINNKQKKILHVAARKVGLIDKYGCKEQYKLVLINVTGKNSSTKLTQPDYDKLVIWFRDTYKINIGSSKASKSGDITTRHRKRINDLLSELPGVNLTGVIHKITGFVMELDDISTWTASEVIDALTAIKNRMGSTGKDTSLKEEGKENERKAVKADQLDRRKGHTGG